MDTEHYYVVADETEGYGRRRKKLTWQSTSESLTAGWYGGGWERVPKHMESGPHQLHPYPRLVPSKKCPGSRLAGRVVETRCL